MRESWVSAFADCLSLIRNRLKPRGRCSSRHVLNANLHILNKYPWQVAVGRQFPHFVGERDLDVFVGPTPTESHLRSAP